ncbi:MAG: ATP-dependent Clp protease adaptor ClpS [Bacteroidia bacterium]|nr:ATP-dependent Clp protease adaptor ClpS [Bacteroidia bacterium]
MEIFPQTDVQVLTVEKTNTETDGEYHVILLDDDAHTYDYVIEMLMDTCGHTVDQAYKSAVEVDSAGFVIVFTAYKSKALEVRDSIHAYGADWRIPTSAGGMSAIVEPAELFD